MKGIILAAGRGKRLRPITDTVAKALLPIKGKPAIEWVIKNLSSSGVNDIYVVVGHLGKQVTDHLGDGSQFACRLTYRRQKEQLGMANALTTAMDFFDDVTMVIASDCILPVEHLEELQNLYFKEGCDAVLSLKELDEEEILSSAMVKMKKDASISRIIEKPRRNEVTSNIASSPAYIFNSVIKEYLPKVEKSRRGEYEVQDAIQMMIDDGLTVRGLMSESFLHLTNMEDLLKLNFEYMEEVLKNDKC